MRFRVVTCVLLAVLAPGLARADAPPPPPAPRIELLTMGPGDDLFTRFGHAALRVTEPADAPGGPSDLVYNYGVTSFDNPSHIVLDFLLGRVRFWVAVTTWDETLDDYADQDRTIYRQPLALSPDAARSLAARLAWNALPANRYYIYDHFRDNCTTRVRDLLDAVTAGALSAAAARRPASAVTYRQLVREGLHDHPLLLVANELVLGAWVDQHPTAWQAMFLPANLRAEAPHAVTAAGTPLAPAEPILAYTRAAPPTGHPGDLYDGVRIVALAALALLGLLALLATASRFSRAAYRAAGVAIALLSIVPALVGAILWALAIISVHPILRWNANLLVLLPTDLVLVPLGIVLAVRGRAPRILLPYVAARAALCALVAAAELTGLIPQAGLPAVLLGIAVPLGSATAVLAGERNAAALYDAALAPAD